MSAKDKRRIDMLVRLRGFCAEHPELFASAKDAQKTLEALDAMIERLRMHLQAQDSGLASFHEYASARGAARTTLRQTLESIKTFAATLGTVGIDDRFRLQADMADGALIVRARSFATEAMPIADALIARGLPPIALAELPDEISALESAIAAGAEQRRIHVSARAGIEESLKSATQLVRRLDAMVLRGANRDAATVAGWKNIRRVGPTKGSDATATTPPVDQTKAA